MNKEEKKVPLYLKIILGIVALIIIVFVIAGIVTNKQMNAKEIKFDNDVIPTVNALIGKRNVSGVSSEINGSGAKIKTITYNKIDDEDDKFLKTSEIIDYIDKLEDEGWLITKLFSITSPTAQLGIESKDDGDIIRIDISFDRNTNEATFIYTKGKGTLTRP